MGFRLTFLASFLLIICSFQVLAQPQSIEELKTIISRNKKDTTEVKARYDLFRAMFHTNPEEGKKHLDKALELALELDYKPGAATCYIRYSIYHTSRGEYDESIKVLRKAKALYSEINDQKGINACLNGEANICLSKGEYDKALELCMKTEEMSQAANLPREVASAKHNISLIYFTLKKHDEALKYLEEALEIKEKLADSSGMMSAYNGIGAVLAAQEKHAEAQLVYHKALKLSIRLGIQREQASISNNIGSQHYLLNDLDSAGYYYVKALNIYKSLNEQNRIAEVYSNLGNLELAVNNNLVAKKYYDSCLVIAQTIKAMPTVLVAYLGLSESNAQLKNFEIALDWHKKYHSLNDSLVGERVKNNINELQVQYDASKKDLQITKLEKSELEANVTAEKNRQWLIILGAAAVLIVVLLLFYVSRKNARAREKASALEQKVLRAQMNPHFIFNSLNSIQRMYIEGKEDIANDYMADFSRLMRSILENSAKNRIKLKKELEITRLYLDLEQLRTDHLFDYDIHLDESIDLLKAQVPPLIFQPYMENAIWHGIIPKDKHGKIQLNIQKKNGKQLVCEISDDGVGYDTSINKKENSVEKTSKGMEITAERLGGEDHVQIESLETGTKITVLIDIRA